MKQLLRKGLSIVPSELRKQAVVLSIDDTMAEKSGESLNIVRNYLTMQPIAAPII